MDSTRAPYGHRGQTGGVMDPGGDGRGPGAGYRGETYYDMKPLKQSHYRWLVVLYLFVGGLASAAQFLATVLDLFGGKRDRSTVRAGRYIALAGAVASPILLIADLQTPQRWYNMLRIFRRSSPMSIGSWALVTFGGFSGLTAAGQVAEDLFGWAAAGRLARLLSIPAALSGGVVSLYTGTLLAATSIPLWASAFPFLSSLFASSAASTATAALTLAADATGAPESTRRRLGMFALITSSAELFFATRVDLAWRNKGTGAPLRQAALAPAWRFGVFGLGIALPLLVHLVETVTDRVSRTTTRGAALAALAGGFILRAVMVFGGRDSAERAEDYFRWSQPDSLPEAMPGSSAVGK